MSGRREVAFLDLAAINGSIAGELRQAADRTIQSGYYIGGSEVDSFESRFAEYCDVPYCKGLGNGLDALRLALAAHGVGPGDEVLVPAHTFIATWLAVSAVGAVAVPVDADDVALNMDWRAAAKAIGPRTKAILIVHLYGRPSEIGPFAELCRLHGLALIEDAAQAHGARYNGRPIGSHGNTAAWSFYPGKNLGALGDAGAITTPDAAVADRVALVRNYGSSQKYHHEVEGLNSRLDPIQAAFLSCKLPLLDRWIDIRRQVAGIYFSEIDNPLVRLPPPDDVCESSWHLFVVRTPDRDRLQQHLKEQGVDSLIHYPCPPHLQPAYRHLGLTEGAFAVAERASAEVLSLPIGPHMIDEDARWVARSVNSFA